MNSKMTLKMWLGLGTAMVLAGNAAHAAEHMAHAKPPVQLAGTAHAAGDGGEGGESGVTGTNPDEWLSSYLMLIRGHLMIGAELFRAGAQADSLPHFMHPKEEILETIEDMLKERNALALEGSLAALLTAAKANDKAAFETALTAAQTDLDAALATTPQTMRASSEFVMNVALEVLKVAVEEYEAAVIDGKIVNVVEYHDSRGFLQAATGMIEAQADALKAKDAEAYAVIETMLADLATNWPTATPPHAAVKTPEQVASAVSQIELRIGRFK